MESLGSRPGCIYLPAPSPTFLDAVLQVVDDGCQDGGETHDLGALRQAEGEELVPAGPHQAGVAVLSGNMGRQLQGSWHFSKPQHAPNKRTQQASVESLCYVETPPRIQLSMNLLSEVPLKINSLLS